MPRLRGGQHAGPSYASGDCVHGGLPVLERCPGQRLGFYVPGRPGIGRSDRTSGVRPESGSDPAAPKDTSPSPQPMSWDPAIVCRTVYGEARKARGAACDACLAARLFDPIPASCKAVPGKRRPDCRAFCECQLLDSAGPGKPLVTCRSRERGSPARSAERPKMRDEPEASLAVQSYSDCPSAAT